MSMEKFEIVDNAYIVPSDRLTISAELAGRIIHRSPQNIREGLKRKLFEWGEAFEKDNGSWVYYVYTCQFLDFFRIPYKVVLVE